MRTQSADTPLEIERIQIAGIRRFTVAQRFALVRDMTASMVAINTLAERMALDESDGAREFIRRMDGPMWAAIFDREVSWRDAWTRQSFDIDVTLRRIIAALEQCGARGIVCGSLAYGATLWRS